MKFATYHRILKADYLPQIQQQLQPSLQYRDYPPYIPCNEKVSEFHNTDIKIRVLFGGNRAGKTTAGAYELLSLARKYPGEIFWAGALSFDFCHVSYKKILEHVAKNEITHTSWIRVNEEIPSLIVLNDQTPIYFKSYEQGWMKFQAVGVKGIWLDELPEEKIFAECVARTIDTEGYLFFTLTPLKGRDWTYKRIVKANNSQIKYWTISLYENKYISPEQIAIAESIYTKDERDSRIDGKHTVLEGGVFKEFNPERHIVTPFKIPGEWRRAIAIDFGWHHPFAVLFGALAPDGTLFCFEGYKESERLLEDHYAKITAIASDLSLYEAPGKYAPFYQWEVAISDHEAQTRAELDALGLHTIPANKEVMLGVELLNRLFKHDKIQIFSTLPELTEELDSLVYKPISDKSDDKDVILKKNDHLTDCLRYLAMYFFGENTFMPGTTEIIMPSQYS